MKERAKKLYVAINKRYPVVGSLLLRLHHKQAVNTVKRRIDGTENVVVYNGAILSNVVFDIVGNNNSIKIGRSCIINSVEFSIKGNNHSVTIGEGCRFSQGGSIVCEDEFCKVEIGDRTTFVDVHIAVTESGSAITIGRDCLFAYDIDVRSGDSHSIIDTQTNERINYAEDVSIGNHVWIAAHCIILKGTSIPDGSVLAGGSVATREFSQKGTIIAGNPARVVREGVSWTRERIPKPS